MFRRYGLLVGRKARLAADRPSPCSQNFLQSRPHLPKRNARALSRRTCSHFQPYLDLLGSEVDILVHADGMPMIIGVGEDLPGRTMARIGLRMMPPFPWSPPNIPYGGFSPVRLQGRYIRRGLPGCTRSSSAAGLPSPFVRLAYRVCSPFCAGERAALVHLRSSCFRHSTPWKSAHTADSHFTHSLDYYWKTKNARHDKRGHF
jgi:hypothetical protein